MTNQAPTIEQDGELFTIVQKPNEPDAYDVRRGDESVGFFILSAPPNVFYATRSSQSVSWERMRIITNMAIGLGLAKPVSLYWMSVAALDEEPVAREMSTPCARAPGLKLKPNYVQKMAVRSIGDRDVELVDEQDGEVRRLPIITLADCEPGELVFMPFARDTDRPRWDLVRVVGPHRVK